MRETVPTSARPNVQRLVLHGFDTECCEHLVLKINDAARVQRWLQRLLDRQWIKHSASDSKANHPLVAGGASNVSVNIGFTAGGLLRLGVANELWRTLEERAPAFAEGAAARAARRLGDTGASAAEYWDKAFASDQAHVLLSVHANTAAELDQTRVALRSLELDDGGLRGWDKGYQGRQLTENLDEHGRRIRKVHFGLRDGISRPGVVAGHGPSQLLKPGELLLGYLNEAGFDRWSESELGAAAEFFRDASFAAFRPIAQDEAALSRFLDDRTGEPAFPPVADKRSYLLAKMVGRWPNGARILPNEVVEPARIPGPGAIDSFDYGDDTLGHGCPFGAHIRRTNPRAGPSVHARPRPLFRRGMPYGPAFNGTNGSEPRGLLGLFFCASLEDQFEHVMGDWINRVPIGPDDRGNAKDPIAGLHEDPRSVFDIPRASAPHLRLSSWEPFLTTRGTLYALYPSLHALSVLARGPGREEPAPEPIATEPFPKAARALQSLVRVASVPPGWTGIERTKLKAPLVPPGNIAADTAPPDRYCDLVMEGGITSGILYPPAVEELAKAFRFVNISGSSVGAFAAAVTAAAEYRRRHGFVDGFRKFGALPGKLAEETEGESHLYWLFRPEPSTQRLFRVFVAGLNRTSWSRRLVEGARQALREYAGPVKLGILIVSGLFGAGVAVLLLVGALGIGFGGWLAAALGVVVVLGAVASYLVLAALGALIGALVAIVSDVVEGLVPNGFGLCNGGPRPDIHEGSGHGAPHAPTLTESLHDLIQACAGRHKPEDAPLTFKDLWDAPGFPPAWIPADLERRSINFEVYATNLQHGRPYRFPLTRDDDMGRLFFKAHELAPYFPARVMQHLVGHAKRYARELEHSEPSADRVDDDILELPREQLPIVVAARLSLSFPLLISAVPLWAIDFEPPPADRRLKRVWFSDGGLCSNFPIHLFDAFIPRWPSFGISLQTRSEVRANQRVWLPRRHDQGRADLRSPCDLSDLPPDRAESAGQRLRRLGCFLSSLWNAPWRWNDTTTMRMPGVRDRVVRVFLRKHEGGINLRMRPDAIKHLADEYGVRAAHEFIDKFLGGAGWNEHRWVRFNALLSALRGRVGQVRTAIRQRHHAMPLRDQIAAALMEPPLSGKGERPITPDQARELNALLDALEQLELDISNAGNTSPYKPQPRPALRTRHPT
jgi:deferrochelatase/peroxidase EfeB/predicted acylesterase/phospholipase RssA